MPDLTGEVWGGRGLGWAGWGGRDGTAVVMADGRAIVTGSRGAGRDSCPAVQTRKAFPRQRRRLRVFPNFPRALPPLRPCAPSRSTASGRTSLSAAAPWCPAPRDTSFLHIGTGIALRQMARNAADPREVRRRASFGLTVARAQGGGDGERRAAVSGGRCA